MACGRRAGARLWICGCVEHVPASRDGVQRRQAAALHIIRGEWGERFMGHITPSNCAGGRNTRFIEFANGTILQHVPASRDGVQRRQAAALHMVRGAWAAGRQGCLPGTACCAPTKPAKNGSLPAKVLRRARLIPRLDLPSTWGPHLLCPYEETTTALPQFVSAAGTIGVRRTGRRSSGRSGPMSCRCAARCVGRFRAG